MRRTERRRRRSQRYVKPARRSSACHDERIGRRSEGYEKCRLAILVSPADAAGGGDCFVNTPTASRGCDQQRCRLFETAGKNANGLQLDIVETKRVAGHRLVAADEQAQGIGAGRRAGASAQISTRKARPPGARRRRVQ